MHFPRNGSKPHNLSFSLAMHSGLINEKIVQSMTTKAYAIISMFFEIVSSLPPGYFGAIPFNRICKYVDVSVQHLPNLHLFWIIEHCAMPPQNRPHLQSHYRMQRNTQCLHVQVDWIKYQKRGLFFAHIMCGSLGTNDICTDYLIVEFVVSNDNDVLGVCAFCFTAHLPPKTCLKLNDSLCHLPSVHLTAGRSSFITTSQKFSADKKFCLPHHKSSTPPNK